MEALPLVREPLILKKDKQEQKSVVPQARAIHRYFEVPREMEKGSK